MTSGTGYDIPQELTTAEKRLKEIYAEFRALTEEARKKKEAESAAAKRKVDLVAEDASTIAKKLKNSGLLEKIQSDSTAKAQGFKRAGALERRLQTKVAEGTLPDAETSSSSSSSKPSREPAAISTSSRPAYGREEDRPSRPRASFSSTGDSNNHQSSGRSREGFANQSSSESGYRERPPRKSFNESGNEDASGSRIRQDTGHFSAPSFMDLNHGTDRQLAQESVAPQKKLYVEADNLDHDFLVKIFERFGPIIRIDVPGHKRFAFVLFKMFEHAEVAIRELNGKVVDGVNFRVSLAKRPERRGGMRDAGSIRTDVPRDAPVSKVQEKRELISYEDGEVF